MNALEKGLRRGIPFEKAASFFCSLKSFPLRGEDDVLMAACVKQAAAKLAEEDNMPAEADALTPPGSQGKGKDNGASEYVANEAAAQEATDQNSVSYYQQVMEQLRAELAEAQESASQATQEAEQLQQQQEGHEQQIAAATQEGQIAQQAAIQQVNTANTMASQAMQSAVDASNKSLESKAMETTSKIQQQGLRSQLFDLASEGLPGTEPELGGEGNAAEGLAPVEETAAPGAAGGEPGGDPNGDPNAEGATQEGGTDSQVEGAEAGLNEAGEPAQGPSPAPEGAPAAAVPDAAPPAGDGSDAPPQANADAATSPTTEKNRQVSIKVGGLQKTAGLGQLARDPRVLGGLAGAAFGAGAAGLEASGHGPKTQDLQAKVDAGQQAVKKPGLGGFAQALGLAEDRLKLTASEATQSHPVAATITGGLLGAGVGAAAGPQLKKLVTEAAQLHKR